MFCVFAKPDPLLEPILVEIENLIVLCSSGPLHWWPLKPSFNTVNEMLPKVSIRQSQLPVVTGTHRVLGSQIQSGRARRCPRLICPTLSLYKVSDRPRAPTFQAWASAMTPCCRRMKRNTEQECVCVVPLAPVFMDDRTTNFAKNERKKDRERERECAWRGDFLACIADFQGYKTDLVLSLVS